MQTPLAIAAVETGLLRLFNTQDHFCICDFDNITKIAGVPVPESERDVLRAFHCVKYHNMSPGVKEMIASKVMEILRRRPDWKLEIKVVFQPPLNLSTNLIE